MNRGVDMGAIRIEVKAGEEINIIIDDMYSTEIVFENSNNIYIDDIIRIDSGEYLQIREIDGNKLKVDEVNVFSAKEIK